MRIAVATVVAFLAAVTTAQASFPGANGSIAYEWWCYDDGCPIGLVSEDGSSSSSILLPGGDGQPGEIQPANIAWSPDGRQLAFDGRATSLGSGRALYVVNADGTGLRQVGRGDLRRYNPAWSPDGRNLVFTQDNGSAGSGDVYTMTVTGASLRRLTSGSSWEGGADWSPDGTRIAYTCRSGGRLQVCQMTPTGGSKTVTTAALNLGGDVSPPSWSPDSSHLTFSVSRPYVGSRVYTMTRSGGDLEDITPPDDYGERDAWNPAWSPDGTRIAFEQACGNAPCWGFRSVLVDGSDPRWITGSEDGMPLDANAWQPLP